MIAAFLAVAAAVDDGWFPEDVANPVSPVPRAPRFSRDRCQRGNNLCDNDNVLSRQEYEYVMHRIEHIRTAYYVTCSESWTSLKPGQRWADEDLTGTRWKTSGQLRVAITVVRAISQEYKQQNFVRRWFPHAAVDSFAEDLRMRYFPPSGVRRDCEPSAVILVDQVRLMSPVVLIVLYFAFIA